MIQYATIEFSYILLVFRASWLGRRPRFSIIWLADIQLFDTKHERRPAKECGVYLYVAEFIRSAGKMNDICLPL